MAARQNMVHARLTLSFQSPPTNSRVVTQNSPSMRRIMSEWKMVQAEGLTMGEGEWSARGNSSDTFRLKVLTYCSKT